MRSWEPRSLKRFMIIRKDVIAINFSADRDVFGLKNNFMSIPHRKLSLSSPAGISNWKKAG